METRIHFGKIYIVEWLAPGDAKTGWALLDELQPIGLASRPSVDVSYKHVNSRDEFIGYLRTIPEDFRSTKLLPLLHIEAHGWCDGICSSAGDEVLWYELMQELIPINLLTQLRLTVVIAACEGFWGIQMLQPVDRAAFFAMIGPSRKLSAGEVFNGCLAFYRGVLQTQDGPAAFKAMNDVVDPAAPAFNLVHVEILFRDVYRAFLKDGCSDAELQKRLEGIVAENARRFKADHGVGMWAHEVDASRALARTRIEAHREHFEEFRKKFFFIDVFPENENRFPITIDDCRDGSSN